MGRQRACTDVEFYLRSVARRWKREIEGSDRVVLLSPYLSSKTAEAVIKAVPGESCDIYTVFKAENFASRASSIHTLVKLRRHGCSLYDLPNLHAKIVLVPGSFASIGSQNATRQGTLNREATAVFTDPKAVAVIETLIRPWLDLGRAITDDMIDDILLALPPLIKAMRKVQRACEAFDERERVDEQRRVGERARREEERKSREDEERKRCEEECARRADEERLRREAELERLKQERLALFHRHASEVKQRLQRICDGGSVDHSTASSFVANSTWWLTHRHGPVRAPKYGDHLVGSGNWRVDFGANSFHVAYALQQCAACSEAIPEFGMFVNSSSPRRFTGYTDDGAYPDA